MACRDMLDARRTRNRFKIAVCILASSALLGGAATAQAASGPVTLSFGNHLCTAGGTVNATGGAISPGGSWNLTGGNRANSWAIYGTRLTVNARVYCRQWWGAGYWRDVINAYRYAWPGATTIYL